MFFEQNKSYKLDAPEARPNRGAFGGRAPRERPEQPTSLRSTGRPSRCLEANGLLLGHVLGPGSLEEASSRYKAGGSIQNKILVIEI